MPKSAALIPRHSAFGTTTHQIDPLSGISGGTMGQLFTQKVSKTFLSLFFNIFIALNPTSLRCPGTLKKLHKCSHSLQTTRSETQQHLRKFDVFREIRTLHLGTPGKYPPSFF